MNAACHHTVHAIADNGTVTGSWQRFHDKAGEYVACGRCGKWYGRIVKASDPKPAKAQKN